MTEAHPYRANRAPMGSDEQRCLDCEERPEHSNHRLPLSEEQVREAVQRLQPEAVQATPVSWQGDSPFFLRVDPEDGGNLMVDIDEGGWIEKNKVHMRSPGTWFLMAKRTNRPLFSVVLNEGDQFYFTKRHVGDLMAGREVLCYGIGKKKANGTPVNLWLLPNGVICGGDDVDTLAARMM